MGKSNPEYILDDTGIKIANRKGYTNYLKEGRGVAHTYQMYQSREVADKQAKALWAYIKKQLWVAPKSLQRMDKFETHKYVMDMETFNQLEEELGQ